MIFMAFFYALGGSVGLLKRSKVQPPPLRGSVGLFNPSKVHGGEYHILGGGGYKVTFV